MKTAAMYRLELTRPNGFGGRTVIDTRVVKAISRAEAGELQPVEWNKAWEIEGTDCVITEIR